MWNLFLEKVKFVYVRLLVIFLYNYVLFDIYNGEDNDGGVIIVYI